MAIDVGLHSLTIGRGQAQSEVKVKGQIQTTTLFTYLFMVFIVAFNTRWVISRLSSLIGGGNRSTRRKPPMHHQTTTPQVLRTPISHALTILQLDHNYRLTIEGQRSKGQRSRSKVNFALFHILAIDLGLFDSLTIGRGQTRSEVKVIAVIMILLMFNAPVIPILFLFSTSVITGLFLFLMVTSHSFPPAA